MLKYLEVIHSFVSIVSFHPVLKRLVFVRMLTSQRLRESWSQESPEW